MTDKSTDKLYPWQTNDLSLAELRHIAMYHGLVTDDILLRERVRKVCELLGVDHPLFVAQVRCVLKERGIKFVNARLRQVKAIQDAGDMDINSGKRKRTFGGLFMHLVKIHWYEGVTGSDIRPSAMDRWASQRGTSNRARRARRGERKRRRR